MARRDHARGRGQPRTLLSLEAVEQIDPKRQPMQPDRELKAQGVGNPVAGTMDGQPITPVIVRSSVNVQAGAHGMLLLASVFALTGLINLIPLASLTAILVHVGVKLDAVPLGDEAGAGRIRAVRRDDRRRAGGCSREPEKPRHARAARRSFPAVFCKDVSFLGKMQVKHHLRHIPDRAVVIIDATRANYIDHDVLALLDAFVADAPRRGIAAEPAVPTNCASLKGGRVTTTKK